MRGGGKEGLRGDMRNTNRLWEEKNKHKQMKTEKRMREMKGKGRKDKRNRDKRCNERNIQENKRRSMNE